MKIDNFVKELIILSDICVEFGRCRHPGRQNHSPIYWAIYIFNEIIRLGSRIEETSAFTWRESGGEKVFESNHIIGFEQPRFIAQKQQISKDKNTLPIEYHDVINCIEEACKKIQIVFR